MRRWLLAGASPASWLERWRGVRVHTLCWSSEGLCHRYYVAVLLSDGRPIQHTRDSVVEYTRKERHLPHRRVLALIIMSATVSLGFWMGASALVHR